MVDPIQIVKTERNFYGLHVGVLARTGNGDTVIPFRCRVSPRIQTNVQSRVYETPPDQVRVRLSYIQIRFSQQKFNILHRFTAFYLWCCPKCGYSINFRLYGKLFEEISCTWKNVDARINISQ